MKKTDGDRRFFLVVLAYALVDLDVERLEPDFSLPAQLLVLQPEQSVVVDFLVPFTFFFICPSV